MPASQRLPESIPTREASHPPLLACAARLPVRPSIMEGWLWPGIPPLRKRGRDHTCGGSAFSGFRISRRRDRWLRRSRANAGAPRPTRVFGSPRAQPSGRDPSQSGSTTQRHIEAKEHDLAPTQLQGLTTTAPRHTHVVPLARKRQNHLVLAQPLRRLAKLSTCSPSISCHQHMLLPGGVPLSLLQNVVAHGSFALRQSRRLPGDVAATCAIPSPSGSTV